MKLAIVGSSPLALEAALRFHLHGAALTWFNAGEVDYETYFEKSLTPLSYTTETGLHFLKEIGQGYNPRESFDFNWWKTNYFLPLSTFLGQQQKVRSHEVVSITKRFLGQAESISNKTRFFDLFRLIFQVDPKEFIKEQEESNPETFERLSQELVESLQTNLEMYEDFDIVVDVRKALGPQSLSITGRALGESRVSKDHLKYGHEALSLARSINQDPLDVREMAIVGSGEWAAEVLLSLSQWLKDQRSRLFVISEEPWPFQQFLSVGEDHVVKELKKLFAYMEDEFQNDVTIFHQKLREWQNLDDYVQVKMPRPVEPIPRLVFFSGHNATAVDQLIDKRRLFLTLEKPDFREGLRHPENNNLDLKTIGVDRILVLNKLKRPDMSSTLVLNEIGHFAVDLHLPNIQDAWKKDLETFKGIEHEIFKLFTPSDAH
jgi:hypothetical protein